MVDDGTSNQLWEKAHEQAVVEQVPASSTGTIGVYDVGDLLQGEKADGFPVSLLSRNRRNIRVAQV